MLHQLKWKDEIIPNYFINDDCEIFIDKSNFKPKPFKTKEGRYLVCINFKGLNKVYRMDYLVAYSFISSPIDPIRLIHLDDDNSNYKKDNLMWLRRSDIIDKYKDMYTVDNIDDITEEWKLYPTLLKNSQIEISSFGVVRDYITKEIIYPIENHGYLIFRNGYTNDTINTLFMHRMVAEMFIENPKPDEYDLVNHLDGNKLNNIFYNLEWCTNAMNTEHAHLLGLNNKYDMETIHNICKLISDGVPAYQVSMITGINQKYISKIVTGKRHKDIMKQYVFQKKPSLDEKYNKDLIIKLIDSGNKPKEIAELTKNEYNQSFISYYERLKRSLKNSSVTC